MEVESFQAIKPTLSRKALSRKRLSDIQRNLTSDNKTPDLAELIALDFKYNGGRARAKEGDFVGPRWVIDQEVTSCLSCKLSFDWINRRE